MELGVGWIGFGTLAGLLLVKFQMLSCYHQHVTFVTFGAAYFSTYDHMAPTWIVPIATWEVLRKIAPALSASSDGHELIPALICFWGTSCFPAGAPEQRWASLLWSSSNSPSWRWSWSWTLGESAAIRHHDSSILLMVHTIDTMYIHIITYRIMSSSLVHIGNPPARRYDHLCLILLRRVCVRTMKFERLVCKQSGYVGFQDFTPSPPLQAQEIICSKGTIAKFTRSRLKDMRLLFCQFNDWGLEDVVRFLLSETGIRHSAFGKHPLHFAAMSGKPSLVCIVRHWMKKQGIKEADILTTTTEAPLTLAIQMAAMTLKDLVLSAEASAFSLKVFMRDCPEAGEDVRRGLKFGVVLGDGNLGTLRIGKTFLHTGMKGTFAWNMDTYGYRIWIHMDTYKYIIYKYIYISIIWILLYHSLLFIHLFTISTHFNLGKAVPLFLQRMKNLGLIKAVVEEANISSLDLANLLRESPAGAERILAAATERPGCDEEHYPLPTNVSFAARTYEQVMWNLVNRGASCVEVFTSLERASVIFNTSPIFARLFSCEKTETV